MLERQRMVETPDPDETAEEDQRIDRDGEGAPEKDDPDHRGCHPCGQHRVTPAIALAGHGGKVPPRQPEALGEEGGKCEDQKDGGQHGGAGGVVLRADDGKEDLGRQHAARPAKDQRVAEIGHRLDEPDQEGIGEARRHQRQRDLAERPPAVGAQRLARLFHRGADTIDDPDQDQEGDRREGQHLGDPDARQAVKPAAKLKPRQRLDPLRHHARPAQHHRQGKADDEGRGDDRQDGQQAERFLEGKGGARGDQSKGEAQCRGPGGGADRQEEGAPRDAAIAARQAGQRPDLRVDDVARHALGREGAVEILKRASEHRQERVEDEGRDQRDQKGDGPKDEGVALQRPAFCLPEGDQQGEDGAKDQRARAKGRLSRDRAKSGFQKAPVPAAQADRQPLGHHPGQPRRAGQGQRPAARCARRAGQPQEDRQRHQRKDRPKLPAPGEGLRQRGPEVALVGQVGQPVKAEKPVADAVPRQQQQRDQPGGQCLIKPAIVLRRHPMPRSKKGPGGAQTPPGAKVIRPRGRRSRHPSAPAIPCACPMSHRSRSRSRST